MNGMHRRCCKRRIPETESFRSSAASTMVRRSTARVESFGIIVKEHYSVGNISCRWNFHSTMPFDLLANPYESLFNVLFHSHKHALTR